MEKILQRARLEESTKANLKKLALQDCG